MMISKTAQDNIDLQTAISFKIRFDFHCERHQEVRSGQDFLSLKSIASHIIKVHASAEASRDDTRTSKEYNWLKRYIQYCKTNCHPRLSDSAASMLQESYDMRRQSNETGEAAAIPITVRQLEAIVRLSEALARMRLSQVANEDHVLETLKLFNTSHNGCYDLDQSTHKPYS
ncbi:minichromosome maintenance protein 5 [Datura stramonium]|uniref:DNA helicase n=1 Tax=Datura stramonium TaxID=4076 RepID=A0ABS8UP04_DATST|nr:minichromosome maintenance protein 5 [Datura stramonium]